MSASATSLTADGKQKRRAAPRSAWPKGVSGNPGGRAKGLEQIARAHTPAAIAALVAALKSTRERVPAAIALLDRGWGRPSQAITGENGQPIAIDFRWADSVPTVTITQTIEKIESTATDLESD